MLSLLSPWVIPRVDNEEIFFESQVSKLLEKCISDTLSDCRSIHYTKKWSFPLWLSSVNVTKSEANCGFRHIYWRNPEWKTSFFVQCIACTLLINMIFFSVNISWEYLHAVMFAYSFCWNFRVLWGVLKKSWQERCIQLAFIRVYRYLSQRVRRISE